eukprot:9258005-Prorocentrum_lima.AAC.1
MLRARGSLWDRVNQASLPLLPDARVAPLLDRLLDEGPAIRIRTPSVQESTRAQQHSDVQRA